MKKSIHFNDTLFVMQSQNMQFIGYTATLIYHYVNGKFSYDRNTLMPKYYNLMIFSTVTYVNSHYSDISRWQLVMNLVIVNIVHACNPFNHNFPNAKLNYKLIENDNFCVFPAAFTEILSSYTAALN